jgi:hypothetical protein
LPIGKDTKLVIIEGHVPVDLFESVQGLSAEGAVKTAFTDSREIHQIRCPPSLVFDLHKWNLMTMCTREVVDTLTTSFGCGCGSVRLVTHE